MRLPFDLPVPPGAQTAIWDGSRFVVDGKFHAVLEYSENGAGWSEQLTALHEDIAGSDHPMDVASRKDAMVQLKRGVDASATILEIGCSSGYLLPELRTAFPGAVILAADVVQAPLTRLAKALPGMPFLRFDLLRCPLPDACVDCVIMLNVLEHIENDLEALKAVHRLLKASGILLIEVPAGPYLYDGYDAALQHFRRYAARGLKARLSAAGFRIGRASHLGFLLFPGFVLAKLSGRFFPPTQRDALVRRRIEATAQSKILRLALGLERALFSGLGLPFGIRAVCTAHRI